MGSDHIATAPRGATRGAVDDNRAPTRTRDADREHYAPPNHSQPPPPGRRSPSCDGRRGGRHTCPDHRRAAAVTLPAPPAVPGHQDTGLGATGAATAPPELPTREHRPWSGGYVVQGAVR